MWQSVSAVQEALRFPMLSSNVLGNLWGRLSSVRGNVFFYLKFFSLNFHIRFVNRKCAIGSVHMPNAIIVVTIFATDNRAKRRA